MEQSKFIANGEGKLNEIFSQMADLRSFPHPSNTYCKYIWTVRNLFVQYDYIDDKAFKMVGSILFTIKFLIGIMPY